MATKLLARLNLCFVAFSASASDESGSCLLSHIHKPSPSPEPNLSGECRQWRGNSCCMATGKTNYLKSWLVKLSHFRLQAILVQKLGDELPNRPLRAAERPVSNHDAAPVVSLSVRPLLRKGNF